MRSFLTIVAAPTLCLAVLGGIVWENGRHTKPADAMPFHREAKAAVDGWPRVASAPGGEWRNDADAPLPLAAIQLLKPNAYFYRVYTGRPAPAPAAAQGQPAAQGQSVAAASASDVGLLVVQCQDPEDMSGHYPPNCYPRNGKPLEWQALRSWTVPGLDQPVIGMEYRFAGGTFARLESTVVYNFFVLPGRGFVADMPQVRDASGDYQRRHFGATQVQMLFDDASLDQAARDEAFKALIGAAAPSLRKLNPAGL
jgi:hypothetical protein